MPRLLTALVLVLTLAFNLRADQPTEHWYIVQMQGQRSGYMHEAFTREGDNLKSTTKLKLEIKRGQLAMAIELSSEFVETPDGKPVTMKSVMNMGALPVTKTYKFLPDGVEVTAGATAPTKEALPAGEWLTPQAAQRALTAALAKGETKIVQRTLDPSSGLDPITTTRTLVEKLPLDVVGKTIPAIKWISVVDKYANITNTEFTDASGHAVRSETDLGGIKLVVILADKALAMSKLDPPELLVSTLITPDKPIDNARATRKCVLLVSSKGDKIDDLPAAACQKVERVDARTLRITIDRSSPAAAPQADIDNPDFLASSAMIPGADECIAALAAKTLDAAAEPKPARAEKLRARVYDYINKKSLGVGFATAGETCLTRTGDCSEHAVLLCALLRADKIPARVVSGIVYADGFAGQKTIFGYHMWAQALLDIEGVKRWVDLDAALSPSEPFDATHIAIALTSLSEADATNSLVALAPLLGTINIKVESAE